MEGRRRRNRVLSALLVCLLVSLASCSDDKAVRVVDRLPAIYPDYADVTIPVNIAPLNFLLRDSARSVEVYVDGELLCRNGGNGVVIGQRRWRKLMESSAGKTLQVTVRAEYDDYIAEYALFSWYVVGDSLDPYLTYRLIEPDYEVYSRLTMEERCVENFDRRSFSDYETVGNRCMNCHTFNRQDPQQSMFYVRGEGGGAVLNTCGSLSLLDLSVGGKAGGSVYFAFHPEGRYVVFSANNIIPAFHSSGSRRLEVYDDASDIYVADLADRRIYTNQLLCDSLSLTTFPTFSPDGKYIYFCSARNVDLPEDIGNLQYKLCRIAFDNGVIGEETDTLYEAGTSVCHPRVSPDGRYLLYTVQDYGTFPIWHREADLRMMDLRTGQVDSLTIVNSDRSDTYHSWSSNSRWFVFASKRDDGLYGKPYFCYVDREGKAHKPFVLPQRDPEFYDNCLKSFNVPEIGRGPLPFSAEDVDNIVDAGAPEPFSLGLHTPSL